MRIELRDINGQSYSIATANGKLAAQWLAEYMPLIMMAAKTHLPWQIYIWPMTPEEQINPEHYQIYMSMNKAGMLTLAEKLIEHANKLPS